MTVRAEEQATTDRVSPLPPPTRPREVDWLLRALPFVLLTLTMGMVLCWSALRLNNDDTWFHLSLGRHFLDDWSLGHPGRPTPYATSDWVATQWSTEVVARWCETTFGLPGVAWLFGAVYLAFILTTYLACRRRSSALVASVVTLLVVLACASTLSARPQVVSLALLTLTTSAWLRTAEDGRPRWWLVPLTFGWATAHGLWSLGVLVGLVCWVGLLLDGRAAGRRALVLLGVPVLSLAVTALTPVGPRLLTSQLAVSARASMIAEWGPTSFRTLPAFVAAGMVACLVVLWSRRGRVGWTPLLLLLLAAGWMLLVTRLVPTGAIVVAPMLASALQNASSSTLSQPSPLERGALGGAAVVYLVALALLVPHTAADPSAVPAGLTPRLEALPAGSRLLVEDGIGGWVEWRTPRVSPVLDGMLDAYPVAYIQRFQDYKRLAPGWQDFVHRSGAEDAVLVAGSPLSSAIVAELGWREVERDGGWVFLSAPAGG